MSNITITNNNIGSVILENAKFRDEVLQFPGADTYAPGTILARKSVATAVVAAADAGNTGDGTVTAASVVSGPVVPLVGAYVLTVITAVANGGVLKLEDPNGALVAGNLVMTVGAGAATVFEVGGLTFTVTDGAVDFVAGDFFTLTVAADGDLVVFATNGVGGAQIPLAILTYEVVATAQQDIPIRAGVAGEYRKELLIIDADGDDSNITNAVMDQLRHFGLVPINVTELNIQDNQ